MPGRLRSLAIALLLVAVALARPRIASAESPCSADLVGWVEACAERSGRAMVADACPSGMLIVRAELGDAGELRVELRRPGRGALETAGELGLSPIGEFPSWSAAPAPIREAFVDVVACARERPPPSFTAGPPRPRHTAPVSVATTEREQPEPAVPWLALAGLLGVGVVVARTGAPLRRREHALVLGLALAAIGVAATIEWSYFLQNGHGPEWVRYALTGDEALGGYGPGYAELLGGVVRRRVRGPELALGRFYLGLSAVSVAALYWTARSVGARTSLAAVLALAVALEPTILRLVRSAAYHPPIFALHAVAVATLVLAARRTDPRAPRFWIGALAAGLLVAQAARIHPVGWVSAAVLPATIVFVPGHTRVRVSQAVLAGLAMAAVVVLTSRDDLLSAMQTGPGDAALGQVSLPRTAAVFGGLAVLGLALGFARPTPGVRGCLILALLGLGLGLAVWLDPLRADLWRYRAGYYSCLAPIVALGVAALIARLGRRARAQRIAAAIVVLIMAASAAWTGAPRLLVATDAIESSLAVDWRARDWGAQRVIYLADVDGRMVRLPLHDPDGLVAHALAVDEVSTVHVAAPTLYYRSSACSLDAGRDACAQLEARLELDPDALFERELPPRTSQPWSPIDVDVVRVGLYMARPSTGD